MPPTLRARASMLNGHQPSRLGHASSSLAKRWPTQPAKKTYTFYPPIFPQAASCGFFRKLLPHIPSSLFFLHLVGTHFVRPPHVTKSTFQTLLGESTKGKTMKSKFPLLPVVAILVVSALGFIACTTTLECGTWA